MIARLSAVLAVLLVTAGFVMLFVSDQVDVGTLTIHESPYVAPTWPLVCALLAGLAAVGIAVASRPARVPVGAMILGGSALLAAIGHTDLVSFYDAGLVGIELAPACVAAVWLLATGGRTRRGWPRNIMLRVAAYLTMTIVIAPLATVSGAGATCSGADPDDDLCWIAGAVIGLIATVVVVAVLIVVCEVFAAVRRRHAREAL